MRREMVEQMTQSNFQPLREQVGRFLGEAQEIENHFSTLDDQTAFINSPPVRECLSTDSGLRFADMKRKSMTVYLVLPANYLKSQGRFLRLIITAALSELYKSTLPKGRKPILFMLDEFPVLGHLENIKDAVGAAAGYDIQIWPIVQNLPQLKANYPKGWETFIDNAGALQILGTNENETAEYFSKKAGNKTVKKASESETIGADGRPNYGNKHRGNRSAFD